jgi:hypothetical protein
MKENEKELKIKILLEVWIEEIHNINKKLMKLEKFLIFNKIVEFP